MLYVSEAKQMGMFICLKARDKMTLSLQQILTISIRIPVYIHQILFDPPPPSHGLLIAVEKNHTF